MPTYEFYNTKTEEVEDHFMSYTKLDEFKKDNPHLQQRVSAPNIVGSVSVKNKEGGFGEVLDKVAEGHPSSSLANERTRKSTKEVKTREVLKKHGVVD